VVELDFVLNIFKKSLWETMRTCALLSCVGMAFAFAPLPLPSLHISTTTRTSMKMTDQIVSPFDEDAAATAAYTPTKPTELAEEEFLELTFENVEKVLDEMRPYLIQDGGNVAISEIDGPVVRLELQVRTIQYNTIHVSYMSAHYIQMAEMR
jgi:lysyl-tRNA synthetase class 2